MAIGNINSQCFDNEYLQELIKQVILDEKEKDHPIGSLEFNTSGINPANYLGFGTWTAWGSGKVPIGVNANDADFNTVEKTGGHKTITLTTSQLPSHNHTFTGSPHYHGIGTLKVADGGSHNHNSPNGGKFVEDGGTGVAIHTLKGNDWATKTTASNTTLNGVHSHSLSGNTSSVTQGGMISNTGSGSAIDIKPEYITCYMFKRTA